MTEPRAPVLPCAAPGPLPGEGPRWRPPKPGKGHHRHQRGHEFEYRQGGLWEIPQSQKRFGAKPFRSTKKSRKDPWSPGQAERVKEGGGRRPCV